MSAGLDSRSRPGPRRRWIWAFVALVTAVVVVAPVALRVWLKKDMQELADPAKTFPHPVTAVDVTAPGDAVAISAGRAGQITVASTLSWVFTKPEITRVWHGRTLAIAVHCPVPDPFEDCSASLTLQVPAAVAIRAAVGSGSATVTGLTGPVRASATSGSLVLAYLSGLVRATVTSGSISGLTGLTSPRLAADAGSGSVVLGFGSAPRSLILGIGSGSAQVTVPPGTHYRIISGPRRPAIQIAPGIASSGSRGLISAAVGSGSLAIDYRGARSSAPAENGPPEPSAP